MAGFQGNLIVGVAAGVATDLAGTPNTAALSVQAVDTLRPDATIVVADANLLAGETSLVTITFTEAVTGFANADLTVDNGTLSTVSSADGGITWTATFTPTANIEDTSNLITLNDAGVTDLAGNAGAGTSISNNYAIDTAAPVASITLDVITADNIVNIAKVPAPALRSPARWRRRQGRRHGDGTVAGFDYTGLVQAGLTFSISPGQRAAGRSGPDGGCQGHHR